MNFMQLPSYVFPWKLCILAPAFIHSLDFPDMDMPGRAGHAAK